MLGLTLRLHTGGRNGETEAQRRAKIYLVWKKNLKQLFHSRKKKQGVLELEGVLQKSQKEQGPLCWDKPEMACGKERAGEEASEASAGVLQRPARTSPEKWGASHSKE